MNEFIDNIIERLENYCKPNCSGVCANCKLPNALGQLKQMAEKYDFCEWRNGHVGIFHIKTGCNNSIEVNYGYAYCPYCGRKIREVFNDSYN